MFQNENKQTKQNIPMLAQVPLQQSKGTKKNYNIAFRKGKFPFLSCLHQSQNACTSAEFTTTNQTKFSKTDTLKYILMNTHNTVPKY